MRPTAILMSEHRVIEQVLSCLNALADRAEAAGRLDEDGARQALDFLRTFADGCHHGKEERYLFPALEARGLPRRGGPTGVMFREHNDGRDHVRALAESLEAAGAGEAGAVWRFVRHAREYVRLLREHIRKEDHCLFPMADRALSAAVQDALLDSFAAVEGDDMGEGTHEKYLRLADELADRLGVPRAAVPGQPACSCGHRGKHD
jgi:hemerythrin-like domain-containing protein